MIALFNPVFSPPETLVNKVMSISCIRLAESVSFFIFSLKFHFTRPMQHEYRYLYYLFNIFLNKSFSLRIVNGCCHQENMSVYVYPPKPHFYIAKLGYAGIPIFLI